jgi:hypothetical protein
VLTHSKGRYFLAEVLVKLELVFELLLGLLQLLAQILQSVFLGLLALPCHLVNLDFLIMSLQRRCHEWYAIVTLIVQKAQSCSSVSWSAADRVTA